MSDTAESIRNKMTPGQLIDEFSGMFTGDGSMLTTLKSQVQGNPLPVALVGVGLAWLMAGQGGSAATSPARPYPTGSAPTPRPAGSYGYSGSDSTGDNEGVMDSIKDKAAGLASAASSMAGSAAEKVSTTAHDAAHTLSGQASSYVSATSGQAAKAATATADMLRQEPLVLAALGLALGTAIGALLPRTDIEDAQVGDLSDKLRDQASQLLQQGVEGAKDVAAQAYQSVKDEADKKGLTGDGGGLVDQIKDVVQATAAQTESNVREKLKTVADKLPGSESDTGADR
ncbi:hypothetical protein [Mesorhizobium sp. ES1-1]|uniref:hypothetical protein n=1 Tax=Mesorhizobium sp. ES1-1 TaxID=2876629 RepID=UPI001CCAD5EC|nr:hypothetical protein [Mesorhizobium sp. ES1-1]